jgi:hypothetical protein
VLWKHSEEHRQLVGYQAPRGKLQTPATWRKARSSLGYVDWATPKNTQFSVYLDKIVRCLVSVFLLQSQICRPLKASPSLCLVIFLQVATCGAVEKGNRVVVESGYLELGCCLFEPVVGPKMNLREEALRRLGSPIHCISLAWHFGKSYVAAALR